VAEIKSQRAHAGLNPSSVAIFKVLRAVRQPIDAQSKAGPYHHEFAPLAYRWGRSGLAHWSMFFSGCSVLHHPSFGA
jgi:hypothetical protein